MHNTLRAFPPAGGDLHPLFAAILAASVPTPPGLPFSDDEREAYIKTARAGEDGGAWAHYVPDGHITLQAINAIVRRSNLDAESKLNAIRAAIDIAINDAADNYIGDAGPMAAADFLTNKEATRGNHAS
jgi:hypothetical protein